VPDGGGAPRPIVIVLHGLEGSARSGYAIESYRHLRARGITAVGLNFRSCSGELNRGARLYHSGETEDLRFVIGVLRRRLPRAPLGAIGFSLGGNVLLKYLGEEGRRTPEGSPGDGIATAAAISVPYDLAAGADYTEHGFARVYTYRLLRSLRRKVRARQVELGRRLDVDGALAARTFREFDDAATAPLHGFRDADDYYRRCSSAAFLDAVRVPTLLVHAEDDPFLPPEVIPHVTVRANPQLRSLFTHAGGHVGFVSGPLWARYYWAETRAAAFVAEHLLVQGGDLQAP